MQNYNIAFISFVRPTFDVELATSLTEQARKILADAGYVLKGPQGVVTSMEQAARVGTELSESDVDLLVLFMATFNDTTMIMEIASAIDVPLLLWALPEPGNDDQLRLNSLCGVNLAGHALTKQRRKYDYIYAGATSDDALARINVLAGAGRVRQLLRNARIGRVGERPPGFETCDYNIEALRAKLGVEVVSVDLHSEVFAKMKQTAPNKVDKVIEQLSSRVSGMKDIEDHSKRGTISAFVVLDELANAMHINGFAIRCWPEFFNQMECAACAAMSMLSDKGLPSSCEADVHGTITQFILQSLSGQPAFGSDLVSVNENEDAIALWHCGLAPLGMARTDEMPRVTNHVGRKLPLLMDFALRPGVVTVARLSEITSGQYRLAVGRGSILDVPKPYHGTSGLIRFERPALDVIDTIIRQGLEHHISITYGNHVESLIAFAEMVDIPVLKF